MRQEHHLHRHHHHQRHTIRQKHVQSLKNHQKSHERYAKGSKVIAKYRKTYAVTKHFQVQCLGMTSKHIKSVKVKTKVT